MRWRSPASDLSGLERGGNAVPLECPRETVRRHSSVIARGIRFRYPAAAIANTFVTAAAIANTFVTANTTGNPFWCGSGDPVTV